ncbi:MAG TPA: HAD family phosphatase [Allosphingosinicella sp.]|jgi:HAD superfamily hydrolase (TIGR01509 family)
MSPLAQLLSRKRLLIFDLDGTLVDSSPLHARAFSEAFALEGIDVDYSEIAGMTTGAAVDRLVAQAGRVLDADKRGFLIADKRARALRLLETELLAIEGSVEFVQAAQSRFHLALCSSGSRPNVETALSRVGLAGLFEPTVTAEDVERSKPDPEGFLQALHHHGLPAEAALVFEDADSGLEAARLAGIDAIRIVAGDSVAPEGAEGMAWAPLRGALEELGA